MAVASVVNDGPFDRTDPLAFLVASNTIDLGVCSLQWADEVGLFVAEAEGGAIVDADGYGVCIETHKGLDAAALRGTCEDLKSCGTHGKYDWMRTAAFAP
jgi:hypothetical protein